MSWGCEPSTGMKAYFNKDFATAAIKLEPCAERGDAKLQSLMGSLYRVGRGVTQNYKTAARWYTLASEQGYARAQGDLGVMYATGQGVKKDFIKSLMWLEVATILKDPRATANNIKVRKLMKSSEISIAQKLARECIREKYKGC